MTSSVNAGARLDRLPICSFHRRVSGLVGMGLFFDSFDNTLSGAVLAAMLKNGWSTLELNSLFMSASFCGLTVGAGLAGWLSDRFGRRFAFQFNLALFGTMALACSMAPSMPWLIAIRAVMGLGMGAEYVMCYGLIIEFMPPERRGRYLGILGIFAGAGIFITSLVGVAVIPVFGWRAMFAIGGIGTLILWWMRRHLPESPRWLEKMGRGREADVVLRRLEKEAGVETQTTSVVAAPSFEPQWVPITVLFSQAVIRRTLMAIILSITGLFGAYCLTGWMPTFFVSQGMSVTRSLGFNSAMMAGYLAGPLVCTLIADRIGRRWGIVFVGVLCAGFGAVYPFLSADILIICCGFLLVSAAAVFLTLALGGSSELFPTDYRFRGAGLAQTVGRAVLIISPFIILSVFKNYGIGGVIGAISGMYLSVAFVMAIAGIETNQRSLEELAPEVTERTNGLNS